MSLNQHLQETPTEGTFTLENLGLDTGSNPVVKDKINAEGVLGDQQPTAPTAVIQSDMRTPGPHDTSMSSDDIKNIPDWNTKICILTDTADKLVDMTAVQKDIEGTGTMDAQRSHVVEATFESFYTQDMPKNGYTQVGTKVGYAYTSQFMRDKIRLTTEALVTQFRELDTEIQANIAVMAQEGKDYCSDELRDTLNQAVDKVVAISEIVKKGPVILPMQGDTFEDVLSMDLSMLDLSKIKPVVPLSDEFRSAMDTIHTVWNDPLFKGDLMYLNSCFPPVSEDDPDLTSGLTSSVIMRLFGESSYKAYYAHFVKNVDEMVEQLQSEFKSIGAVTSEGGVNHELISERGQKLKTLVKSASDVKGRAKRFGDFAAACATALVFLSSLR